MAGGGFAGSRSACHETMLYPVRPDSLSVGKSVATDERLRPVTATAFNYPDRTCGIDAATLANVIWTSLESTASIEGPAPL